MERGHQGRAALLRSGCGRWERLAVRSCWRARGGRPAGRTADRDKEGHSRQPFGGGERTAGRGEGGASRWPRPEGAGAVRTPGPPSACLAHLSLARRRPRSPRCGRRRPPALRFRFRLASAPVAREAAMAYSTVQRVALASGLVLAVSLLLPKAFLSRGKRQEPPPAPEGRRSLAPSSRSENAAPGWGDSRSPPNGLQRVDRAVFGSCQAPRFPWSRQTAGVHRARVDPDLLQQEGPGMQACVPGYPPGGLSLTPCLQPLPPTGFTPLSHLFRCFESRGPPAWIPLSGVSVCFVSRFFYIFLF